MAEPTTLAEWREMREKRAIAREKRLEREFQQGITSFLIDPQWVPYRKGPPLDLSRKIFRGEDLSDGNLVDFILRRADFREATIDRADLTGADLTGAKLRGASLRDAILVKANLTDADLTDADLTGADLTDAILDGATMPSATSPAT